jgi:hypothetical protein
MTKGPVWPVGLCPPAASYWVTASDAEINLKKRASQTLFAWTTGELLAL